MRLTRVYNALRNTIAIQSRALLWIVGASGDRFQVREAIQFASLEAQWRR